MSQTSAGAGGHWHQMPSEISNNALYEKCERGPMFFVVVERIEIVFKCILCIIIMFLNFSSIVLVIVSLLFSSP